MKLLFKQRMFSWFDSYDIYDEEGNTVYEVKGQLAWGHCLNIYNAQGEHIGTVKEEMLTFLPRFAMYVRGRYVGEISKEFSFFVPRYNLDCNGWEVEGDLPHWDYVVHDAQGNFIMQASKELFNWTDTYVIDVKKKEDALYSLMIVLAIDAVNCSNN